MMIVHICILGTGLELIQLCTVHVACIGSSCGEEMSFAFEKTPLHVLPVQY